MKSLIQQRMEITRVRTSGSVALSLAALVLLLGILQLSSPENPGLAWLQFAASIALCANGLFLHARFRRQIREFEREHGAGAGTQTPLA